MHSLYSNTIPVNQQEHGNFKKKQNINKNTLKEGQWIGLKFLNDCSASQMKMSLLVLYLFFSFDFFLLSNQVMYFWRTDLKALINCLMASIAWGLNSFDLKALINCIMASTAWGFNPFVSKWCFIILRDIIRSGVIFVFTEDLLTINPLLTVAKLITT